MALSGMACVGIRTYAFMYVFEMCNWMGGYLCFTALSGVAFCFFSAMTNKLLIPRVLFLTANNGALPVARAIMGTFGETVYDDEDNQKTELGKFPT